jgi:hypothetical protein
VTHETAAARSAALLRQLDASRQDLMRHRPGCEQAGIAVERGHSCTVRRCLSCGSTTAERNVHPTPSTTQGKRD